MFAGNIFDLGAPGVRILSDIVLRFVHFVLYLVKYMIQISCFNVHVVAIAYEIGGIQYERITTWNEVLT